MANIYQLWDNTVLNSVNATPEQLEQKRNELKTRFENAARKNGATSKDIYATIDKFDQYSRQKTTARDDGLTPDEREAARDDGSTILGLNKGGLKESAKAIKDLGLGIVSSVPRVVGDLAQTWSDVGDNDPSELSAQLARKAYDASEDIKSNYSEGTKQRKKDFWSPTGLAMGVGENLGQMALSAGLVGGATKGAMALSKGSKAWGLGAGLTTGMGLAYGQGYGQGKENALEKINNTSNEDLYANVVTEYDDWQKNGAKKGSKPELVSLYEEAEGDLNKMKDLMAENAGAWTGFLTALTSPIAMGATAFMNRGIVNEMARQGTGNIITRNLAAQTGARDSAEFARRVAARDAATGLGGKIAANTAIARQGLKIAGKQSGLQTVEEGAQEWGEGYFAADAGSLARGDKGVLSDKDWSEVNQQGLQGAAIGALMGTGTSLVTMRDAEKTGLAQAKARTALPKQYQDAFNAFEDAKQAEAQAQAAYEANPTPESEEALAQATDARLKANNQFSQYDAAFKQTFTEQEQKDLLANSLSGIAARAKLAEEAKQAELNSKAEQEALAKAQRANMVKGLAAYADNESVLINEVNQLGLDDTQKELLLREVFAERKNAKAKPQQTQAKTPLELAVDEHFDAKGNRKPSVMSSDVADKHKVSLNELLPAIAKRNNDIKIQKAQAEKQAKVDAFNKSQAQQKTKDVQREQLAEQQQLENTLADFAAENDTESMLAMLDGYDKKEADRLFNNAFKTVETRAKEAEKATKTKEAETAKQAQAKQKQSAFNADMSALYESNPNATYSDWKAVGKKYGVTSAIDLANAWASAKSNKPKQKSTETLALPSPNNVMVTDAQGNTTPTTENNVPKKQRNADVSVPSGGVIPRVHLDRISRGLKDGKTVEEIATKIQKSLPHLTIEDVTQQVLAAQEKASKPATLDSIIGKYSDDEEVDEEIRQSAEVLKKFLPETVDDWKIDNDTFATRGAWRVSYTKPFITINRITGKEVVSSTTTAAPLDIDILLSGDEQAIKNHIKERLTKNNITPKGVKNWRLDDTVSPTGQQVVDNTPTKPVSPTNTTQTTPETTLSTTGEQIAEAMDKTAKAITEAAHNKVVERVKNGEEIVYKQPAAIERVKQDERYQIEINDKGHAVVKNVKGNDGNWVKQDKPVKPFSAPSENSPETTIMGFLNDGELENAYFFAENQDKPIKFTLSRRGEPIAYFLTEPVDLGNNITGFVGISTYPMSKSKRWLVIEEKSRTSIGFEEISKRAAIKSAKARLSALKKEDLEGFASKIIPINKTDEEMKADWLAKNNIKIDEQSNEENSINRKTENLAKAEAQAAPTRGERAAEKEKNNNVVENAKPQETIIEHTTKKGTAIRGVVRTGITKQEAQKIDPYTFTKDGGWFIREKYLGQENKANEEQSQEKSVQNNETEKSVVDFSNSSTQKFMPTFDDVMTHLKGIHKLSSELFKDAQTKAVIKNTLENYLDKVMPNDVSVKDFKAITDKFFDEVVAKYPQPEYQSSGKLAHPIPEIRIVKKNPLKATASKSEFNKAFGVNESKIDEIAKDFERKSQNEPAPTKQPENVIADYFNVFTYTKNKEATIQSLYSSYSEFEKSKPSDYVATEYFSEFKQGDPKVIGKVIAYSGDYQGILDVLASGLKLRNWLSLKNRILIANRLKEEIEKDFERESQNNSELNPQESKQPTKKETPIQGKDVWTEVEFIAGNKSKELFYHNRMADPNKPFNTEAEAIADWESKTEEQSNSTIEETKQPTKKERLLIKIDDELDAALDDFAAIFKEQGKRLSSGVDPVIMGKVLAIGMKASTLYLAKGAVKFAVWAENIIAALSSKGVPQDAVQPYLKGLYAASKMQVSPEIRKQMDKEDDVYDFDFATLNVGQEEAVNSIEKTQTTKKTLTDLFYDHLKKGTLPENNAALRKMVAEFDGKEVDNYRLKEAQEMLEAAMARYSRDVVTSNQNGDASTFNQLVDSYNKQPNLNVRTSTSVENQAYSTPAPLAFVAAKMANIGKSTKVYEPTAGNGMLLITALPENATVNEMESTRFNNLKAQGFNAHQGDALKAIENGVIKPSSQDAIITNPPFGSIKENGKTIKVEVDGYKIGKIDHLIAAEALKAMKPNGTAAIIIGADMVQGGISTDDRIFFNWLYSNYNVVSHFEVDGKLYSRQGASWPVRVIIVHGKQESNNNSPVTGAIARYDNWKDVYDQYIKMVVASNNRGLSVGTRGSDNRVENDTATTQPINGVETTQTGARGRNTTRNNDDVGGVSSRDVSNRPRNGGKQLRDSDNVQRFDERTNVQDNLAVGDNRDTGGATRDNSGVGRGSKPNEHTGKDVAVLSDADNSFQVKYTPASSRKDEGVLIPINMRQPLMESLLTLEDSVGDIDKYAAKELGYRNVEQLHDALMGLQVDSVASAIYQIKEKNKGIIIADQTGIGKGRQAAAIIRWAILNGHTPVFVTVKPQLFTDMYGDLSDIGSNNIKPFIVNTGESISGKDGQKLHKTKPDAKHRKEIEDIAADGVLPDEYNAVFITYSQINKANNQQRLLSSLSSNAVFILDESHNAGGASATGLFVQDLLKEAKGVVYLSATFAKRPDNMPLYFKTDMGMAVGETSELSAAVIQGGLPLQTVISNSLVKAGQLFRRERSYNGVSIETKVDSQNKLAHEKLSDEATKALRAIVAADKMFHNTYFAQLEKAMEEQGQQAKAAGNKAEKSVSHHEFSSVVHNFIRQMLLGLKVDTAANEAIAALKRGEKPLIALENTMGSFLNEYVSANGLKEGDSLGNFGYRNVLSRALYRTRAVTIKDKKGQETRKEVGLDELDSETRAAYNAAQKIIDSLDISIPASPIDWMRNRLEAAGYSVAEITGRNMAVNYSTKTPTVSQVPLSEQNDKVGTTRMFNNGELDAIILNVAGSTGISLHASEKFKDQRKRHMIVAQPAQDINIFMQMLGRIHRTGQVILPKYTILSLDLPTEKRPTAVLNKKMKSLNANTSSNTESATSIVSLDMLNKYGDKIVASYLSENQDVARKIGMEVHGDTSTSDTHDDFAKKATGRFALLPVSEQKRIYDEIEPQYAALISYLDETGQNELEPKTVDFDAELKLEAVAVPATDPSTPFGQEAIYGEYKVKPQGKPMSVDEVKALIVKNIGEGVMPAQHTQKLITDGQLAFDSFINTLNEKYYKAAENEEEAGIIQKNIVNQQAVFENTKSFIESHRVGSIWQIDIKGDIYNAVITNVKSTFKKGAHGNPFAQSKILISLAVNGELRSVTVPMTEFSRIEVTKYYGTAQDALKPREGDAGLAKIITGNLLAGYANLVGSDGRVISFTKKDGTTEQGILLPKKFNFKDNVRQDFAIKDANDVFKLLKSGVTDILKTGVASRKGDIRIVHNTNTGGITIYTPKSKSTGGKWFLNKKLIDVVGDFVSSGNMMVVNVPSKKAIDALSIVIEKTPLYVLPSQAEATKELLGYYDGQVNLKSGNNPQDTDNKPKFSRSSAVGDRTITQVRDKLISRFGKRIIDLLESKGILKIHQSMKTLPKGVLDMARGTEDAAYYNGVVHLIADNLTDENIIPAFVHDLSGHKGFQEMMSPKAYELIMQQFYRLVAQGNAIAIKAKQRAERAEVLTDKEKVGKTDKQIKELEAIYRMRQQDEYIPYLLTEQEKAQFATPQQRNAVQRLIDHIVRAVKGWAVRTLSKYSATAGIGKRVSETLDARDIQLMAERMIRDIAKYSGDNNRPKFSRAEQSQFDQLLAKADKMIAEQGKLLAPNGKPSKLNRYQWAQVRTDNFKAWFGNWENDPENASKVVDDNGEPLVVYHGTEYGGFTEFGSSGYGAASREKGFWFSNKIRALEYSGKNQEIEIVPVLKSWSDAAYFAKKLDVEFKKAPEDEYDDGIYFIDDDIASTLNQARNILQKAIEDKQPAGIYPVFLNLKTPKTINAKGKLATNINTPVMSNVPKKYDGMIIVDVDDAGRFGDYGYITDNYVAKTSTQIKSAISNNGEFSPTNPDIRFSRAEDKAKAAKDYVLDSVRIKKEVAANLNAKKELWWWHKTFGTQQNTAIQYKDFGRVYKTLQRLLQHQSSDVTDALEVAPTLLEKLDDWKDFKNQVKAIGRNAWQGAKHKLTDAVTDRMAVAKVIFGETLAKKPLSQAELEQKLTPQQLKIYEEARAAINVSLKNTAKSEIIRSLLQNDVINFDTVEKLLNQQTGFDEFIDEMLENVGARISNAQEELSQAETDVEKQAIKDELKRLADMYNSISDVNTKVYKLIDEAYAPLMRFGDYALTMRDKTTGKVLSFMMFESKAERNRMVNYLGTEYGDTLTPETDTMSTEDFKMFKGVTPETVALFAKELGLDKNEAYQGYLKLAIPATSALTRRIQRKGTAGYNEDIQRVLASFVMSNARYSAKNIYLAKADREISEIESGASVRDQAKKMRDNTIDHVDTFAWLRDLLFVWNLGFSVMFAFLNMTQPFMQTIPMLSQYVNTGFATKHVLRGIGVAGKAMATGNAPKGYEAEYKRAVHEGVVDPQNTFMLTGLERGGTGTTSKVWTGTKHILGIFAQMSESLNRKAVFIASLEVANDKGGAWLKQKGYASAYDFAVDVIAQTQGVYNKANRSNWAHSQLGAPLLVFKQFSINYVEQMIRMAKNNTEGEEGKKAVLLMLFMLFSLAGGMGLPFIKDIFDGSETIAAFMGNPVNIEREMRLMGKQYLGETTTGALMDGWLNKLVIGEVLGADVQSRTSMGDLAPWTNFFNKTIYGTDQQVSEGMSIFGAAGGLGEKVVDSLNFMANDEFGDAFINILPRFATSMYRGVEMMTTGETTDSKGRKLFDTTFGEGLVKFLDSQPVRMAELSRARGLEYDDIAIQRSKIDYYRKKWIKAAQKEDMEAIEEIEQDIEDWNENNEKYPVIFDRQRAYQSANKNEMTWGEREERTPKGMDWLKEERPDWLNE